MQGKVFMLSVALAMAAGLRAQPMLEDLSAGFFGRTEQNIYRYYNSQGIGNYNTIRVTNGYGAGIGLHSSINYLFNGGLSLGLSEASYKPDLERNGSVLWASYLRLWQMDIWGELKFTQNEKSRPLLQFGGQFMFVESKREVYNHSGDAEVYAWPEQRFMPKLGIAYYQELGKKWQLMPYTGMRFALKNAVGYDYFFNQFYAGVTLTYRIKSW